MMLKPILQLLAVMSLVVMLIAQCVTVATKNDERIVTLVIIGAATVCMAAVSGLVWLKTRKQ